MKGVVGVESRENEKEHVDHVSEEVIHEQQSDGSNESESDIEQDKTDSRAEDTAESVEQKDSSEENESSEEEQTTNDEDERVRLETELAEMKNRALRIQADFENFRKRTRAEQAAAAKYRVQPLVEELLPVLDNFERALSVEVTNEESKSILTGVDMVYRQLTKALEAVGVEEIQAESEPFDPHKHQAVMQDQSEEHDSGIVTEVLQKGYTLKDRVIRPAMVKVNE